MMRERKPIIELWFEFVGCYIFDFMWQSSQPAAAEMDRRKFQPLSRTGSAAAKPAPPKPEADKDSSLEALRRGEAAGSGPLKDIGFNFDSAELVGNGARDLESERGLAESQSVCARTDRGSLR